MNTTTKIDVRGMAPPEPFEVILPVLFTLVPGATMQVLIHREPFPLYELLREAGFLWHTHKLAYNEFRIKISRPQ